MYLSWLHVLCVPSLLMNASFPGKNTRSLIQSLTLQVESIAKCHRFPFCRWLPLCGLCCQESMSLLAAASFPNNALPIEFHQARPMCNSNPRAGQSLVPRKVGKGRIAKPVIGSCRLTKRVSMKICASSPQKSLITISGHGQVAPLPLMQKPCLSHNKQRKNSVSDQLQCASPVISLCLNAKGRKRGIIQNQYVGSSRKARKLED